MANPPPFRPWFRLANVRTIPAPAPAPEARPPFFIPTFRSTYSAPSSPQTQPTKPHEQTQPTKPHEQTQPTKPQERTQPQPQAQPHIVATYRGSAPSSPDKKVAHAPSSSLPTYPIQKASLPNTNHYSISSSTSLPQPQPQPHNVAAYRGSAPSSPDKKVAHAPSSSLPNSYIEKASLTNTNHYSISSPSSPSHKMSNTNSSSKTIKAESVYNSPIHSPKLKPTAPPPSPLILPPSQFNSETKIPKEAEQKTMLVQKTIEKPKQLLNRNATELHRESGNHGNSHNGKGKEIETKEIVSHKKVSALDSGDSGMNVITIAGENRGAYMELVHSQKKHEPKYLHKKGNDTSKINGGGDGDGGVESEGSSNGIEENSGRKTTCSFPTAAYMNSNVQCVNNSLLYNASCSHHDPGVHLSLSKKPHGEEVVDDYNSRFNKVV